MCLTCTGTPRCIIPPAAKRSACAPELARLAECYAANQEGVIVGLSSAKWRKSTFSEHNGCVEVALMERSVAVRDTKNRGGPILTFTHAEWAAFTEGVRKGEFDLSRDGR
jgi:hypothetical protein